MKAGIKKVYGVGLNDAGYAIQDCPYYWRWKSMLSRCYCKSKLSRTPSYNRVSVCDEWLTFSNFKAWMEKQDWEGKHLDKDLMCGFMAKEYSPSNCVFINERTNYFLQRSLGKIGSGATYDKVNRKWVAQISNQLTGRKIHIGRFETRDLAVNAWMQEKQKIATVLSETESNPKVKVALLNLFRQHHL